MNDFPTREQVERTRERYQPGMRVELVQMDDVYAPPIGALGTVQYVDDIGAIHVDWDNGSTLSVQWGEDMCRVVSE